MYKDVFSMLRISIHFLFRMFAVFLFINTVLINPASCSAQNIAVKMVWNCPEAKWLEIKPVKGDYMIVFNGRSKIIKADDDIKIGQSGLINFILINNKLEMLQASSIEFSNLSGAIQLREPGKNWAGFRGSLIVKKDSIYWKITNILDSEEYLKGVVPAEMSNAWAEKGLEALKAQAVAARTYLIKNLDSEGTITDSPNIHQAYKGRSAEGRASEAVASTAGEILVDSSTELPINVYYSSHNGGQTEVTENVWTKHDSHYDSYTDPYSQGIGGFADNWHFLISAENLGKTFGLAPVRSVFLEKYSSGRVYNVQLTDWLGNIKDVAGSKFVSKFYPQENDISQEAFLGRLFSVKYLPAESYQGQSKLGAVDDKTGPRLGYIVTSNEEVSDQISKFGIFDFTGRGWGHGVGMSQWGAYNMARSGLTYKEILGFYYLNTKIMKR